MESRKSILLEAI